MYSKKRFKSLAIIMAATILLSCIVTALPYSAGAATTEGTVLEAAKTYVDANRNEVTKEGLLNAVKKVAANAELSDENFYIKYAVPGVTDNDADYPLTIAGSDGAVAAIFTMGEEKVSLAIAFEHIKEKLSISNVAVAGADDNKLIYDDTANIIGCVDGVDKIVVPLNYNGTMAKPDFAAYPALNKVKVVMVKNYAVNLLNKAFDGDENAANWTGLVALDIWDHMDFTWSGTQQKFARTICNCPNLKYLSLPIVMENGTGIDGNYYNLPELENVNVTANLNYPEGCFSDNSVREYVLSTCSSVNGAYREATYEQGAFLNPNKGVNEKNRNIITKSTVITFTQAVAIAVAAVNEQIIAGKEGDTALTDAKAVLASRAWSQESKDYLNALTLAYDGDWVVGDTSDSCKVTISTKTDAITFDLCRIKTLSNLDVGYTLSPPFSADILSYAVEVPSDVTSLDIHAELRPDAELASIEGNSNFAYGSGNIVTIHVTNVDGENVVYTIQVTRYEECSLEDVIGRVTKTVEEYKSTNDTKQTDIEAAINSVVATTGYSVSIEDFYKYKAIGGAKDQDGILVPGYSGSIAVIAKLTKGTDTGTVAAMNVIAPPMKEYTFTKEEISNPADFQISADGKVLEYYFGDAKKIVIPDGIETLDLGWFDGDVKNATVLIIPDSVIEAVGTGMCYQLPHLEVVYIGDGMTTVPTQAFTNDYMLQYVRLSENTTLIDNLAFSCTSALSTLYIPSSVTTVNAKAFYQSGVRDVVLSGNVMYTHKGSFAYPACGPSDNAWLDGQLQNTDEVYKKDVERLNEIMSAFSKINLSVTVLNPEVIADHSFESNTTCRPGTTIVVNAPAAAEDSIAGRMEYVEYNLGLDMSLAEAAARARVAIENLYLTSDSAADDVLEIIQNSYYSTTVDKPVWKDAYAVTNGQATGIVKITVNGVSFELPINNTVHKVEEPQIPVNPENPSNPENSENPENSNDTVDTGVATQATAAAVLMVVAAGIMISVSKRKRNNA